MRLLKKAESEKWCQAHHINVTDQSWRSGEAVISITAPSGFLDCVGLVLKLDSAFIHSTSESLLLVKDWDIWSPEIESMGMEMWKKLRQTVGNESLLESPGHLFSNDPPEQRQLLIL